MVHLLNVYGRLSLTLLNLLNLNQCIHACTYTLCMVIHISCQCSRPELQYFLHGLHRLIGLYVTVLHCSLRWKWLLVCVCVCMCVCMRVEVRSHTHCWCVCMRVEVMQVRLVVNEALNKTDLYFDLHRCFESWQNSHNTLLHMHILIGHRNVLIILCEWNEHGLSSAWSTSSSTT